MVCTGHGMGYTPRVRGMVGHMEIEKMSKDTPKHTKPDHLVKPSKKGGIELSESELKKVTGGATANKATDAPTESVSLNFSKIHMQ